MSAIHYSVPAGVDEKKNTSTLCGAEGERAAPHCYCDVTCPGCNRVLRKKGCVA